MVKKYVSSFTVLLFLLIMGPPVHADAPYELRADGFRAGMTSFNAQFTAYAAYATPTDLFGICGSSTRAVVVSDIWLSIGSTSAALQTVSWIRRKTADTGGTPTTLTPTPWDSQDQAVTPLATVVTFGAAPSALGTSIGTLRTSQIVSSVLTAAYTTVALYGVPGTDALLTRFTRPVVLRGTNDCLYANYGGAALTSGFASLGGVDWSEQ